MTANELIDISLKAGEILLRSGAEIFRVEDTIHHIFQSHAMESECFVLLSGIFISVRSPEGEVVSLIKRIKGHTINLEKIELVNEVSRDIEKGILEYNQAMKQLNEIEALPFYSFKMRLVMAGITAFIYTQFFRGDIYEGLTALLISAFIYAVKEKISQLGFFQFFEYFMSGIIAGAASLAVSQYFYQINMYKVIIGSIMVLVPGVAITNGIKDALYGDTISSLYRLTEALFISVAVAAGVGIALSIGYRWV